MNTAYDAFVEILDINETIDKVKEKNNGKEPDMTLCKVTELLANYRGMLADLMMNTELFKGVNNDGKRTQD